MDAIAAVLATIDTEAPTWDNFSQGPLPICRQVARARPQVVGWVADCPFSHREVDADMAEESVSAAPLAGCHGVVDASHPGITRDNTLGPLATTAAALGKSVLWKRKAD